MSGLQRLSESLYVGLCEKVGTREIVSMRRDIEDISEVFINLYYSDKSMSAMISGSMREGFRFQGSDFDYMFWFNDNKVIHDFSQSEQYNMCLPSTILIFMECEHSPPGFALLKVLAPTNKSTRIRKTLQTSCVKMNNEIYISSTSYRQTCCDLEQNSSIHGPCASGISFTFLEYDHAYCFKCDFWPPSAISMIQRCQTWPPPLVLYDIFNSGCHLVAKGSTISPHEDKEWRISFSQAEQKLVYAMNHCQFLVYGLLKLFLKEVINHRVVEKLLCSYFMKTVVFWEIQKNKILSWCPPNTVLCFWSCFKHIIQWVYMGECPNFFIPQNNMFSGKIVGSQQHNLFQQLHDLYKEGYTCLLLSPSIRSHILQVLYNPTIIVNIHKDNLMSVVDFDTELYEEVFVNDYIKVKNFQHCMKNLHTVEHMITKPSLTQCHLIFLQKHMCIVLQSIAFYLYNKCGGRVSNKMTHISDRISCCMLKFAAKFGFVSDMLYIAMYYYRTCRYREALSVIDITNVNLSQPYLMYRGRVNKELYTEVFRGQSLSTKMRNAVSWNINIDCDIIYINELRLEVQVSHKNGCPTLSIPPLIMLHMLSVLCYNHVDTVKRQQALEDLSVLLYHDVGMYIPAICRDISYQILGLCQEVCGDKQSSLYSYQKSLRQYPSHKIQKATEIRIQHVLEQI